MTAPGGSPDTQDDPGALVGAAVRARRTAAGLSVAELARRAQVSGPFVSQLEGGRSSVSIPVLYRLASALGCAANDLLPLTGEVRRTTRAGEGPRYRVSDDDDEGRPPQRSRLLTRTGEGVLLEAHHYVIHPGDAEQDWFSQSGEVFVHVLRGALTVEFADGTSTDLGAGDSLHHEGDVPHRWVLRPGPDGDVQPVEALAVVTAARKP
ncbi:transcriptional regulator, XRE family with cupin sensor [Quadrisphaera granulorum]|uniref:XRE family transcriptional regulator n=1 Tax=Quadrisphaera granulorum TaxID=317664 RepID=A0A316A9Y1_9ACTN|nr:XRE family transcriptional regulator [Quadrisphaera granulorum]PWJ54209.1 XRE family transcriptional regulator [Quadrisphaera granulorum]SZE96348.1 transcriptional regulator, XRE family with cupin sensor [Quadrisphaera granulorum]